MQIQPGRRCRGLVDTAWTPWEPVWDGAIGRIAGIAAHTAVRSGPYREAVSDRQLMRLTPRGSVLKMEM